MLEKNYDPNTFEGDLYRYWEGNELFSPNPSGNPYTIVIPPPNVTGNLHLGHALNNTLQDIVTRRQRMMGKSVLWQPGVDHAGIATQMVVERNLAEAGLPGRREMGREQFEAKIWEWKAQSGGAIVDQLKRLGAGCDWSRERFTLDPDLAEAVRHIFVKLYRDGYIYRDERLVHWDPKMETAISDLEVISREVKGKLWQIAYDLKDDSGTLSIATTRPETLLGDTAIAVNPGDERYRHLIGKVAILPLVGRELPIIADDWVDAEFGTGAVKITPAHDFNDFDLGKRHHLPMISIFDYRAHLNDHVPERYRGLSREDGRVAVLEDLEKAERVQSVTNITHTVPFGERGGVPTEPHLTVQWFADAKRLAAPAIEAAERGEVTFYPESGRKVFFHWMRNIEPWCISRQLWWGHRIPCWYGPDKKMFVAESEEEARSLAREAYGKDVELCQESDVLDTWFSSALWPFSTLGWPQTHELVDQRYPTDLLVTGWDILFFWVARMMMFGIYTMGKVPFHAIFLHGLIRDPKGAKMSKSKGNVVDPLEIMKDYGADALRLALTSMGKAGRDLRFSTDRVEIWRNFVTKFWNAARFLEMNGVTLKEAFLPDGTRQDLQPEDGQIPIHAWLLDRLGQTQQTVDQAIDTFRFHEAVDELYHFVWDDFCSRWLELVKPALAGDRGEAAVASARRVGAEVFDQILRLLHPFAPFVTEELWRKLGEGGRVPPLASQAWANSYEQEPAPQAVEDINWLLGVMSEIRKIRSVLNVPASALPVTEFQLAPSRQAVLEAHASDIMRMCQVEIKNVSEVSADALPLPIDQGVVGLKLQGLIDLGEERKRMAIEFEKAQKQAAAIQGKLCNPNFVDRAPAEVVEEQQAKLDLLEVKARDWQVILKRLEGLDSPVA